MSRSLRHRYRRFFGRRIADEIDAELRFHVDMRVEELIERGMGPEEAKRAVIARLGDVESARRECTVIDQRQQRREARHDMFDSFLHDLRLAGRSLARQKGWTAVVVATLGLGIGANSSLFSIVNAVLLRPLPYPDSHRIISVSEAYDGRDGFVVAAPVLAAWRTEATSFDALAAYSSSSTIMQGRGDPEIVRGQQVTAGYFAVMGQMPVRGRPFNADEEKPGAPRVIILSDQLWRRMYGADSTVLGATINLDGNPTTVVGIMPPSFTSTGRAQYWIPLRTPASTGGATFYYSALGRLRHDRTIESARTELATIQQRVNAARATEARTATPVVMTLHERRYGDTRPALLLLLSAVGVLLLIACANVSNLILVRAARREGEFAVRIALGASRGRLMRYLLAESVILTTLGAVLALLLARLTLGSAVRLSPQVIARAEGIGIDSTVIVFTAAVAIATGLVFALIPALAVGRTSVNSVLAHSGGRSTSGGRQHNARRALVVAQLATALTLVTGAGLLAKSFATVMSIDPGVDVNRVLLGTVQLSYTRYGSGKATPFFEQFVERVRAIPGVEAAALSDALPLGGARMSTVFTLADGTKSPRFDVSAVGEEYFQALAIPRVSGRLFLESDAAGAPPVAVINQALAGALFPNDAAVGKQLPIGGENEPPVTVVGVVRDARQRGIESDPPLVLYRPVRQDGAGAYMHLVVRTSVNPQTVQRAIRETMLALDPTQPPPQFMTPQQVIAESVAPRRFNFVLLGILATVAALLAAIGLYGVMSYAVAERTREFGIRAALGADRARVLQHVMKEGVWLTVIALAMGGAGSYAAVQLLRNMLFQVSVHDPWIFAAGGLVLGTVALIACLVPALRATRVDPVTALRG
ncbi:MAG TPA: ABC transporter permease [Gemmatimonadaceae bacterium]